MPDRPTSSGVGPPVQPRAGEGGRPRPPASGTADAQAAGAATPAPAAGRRSPASWGRWVRRAAPVVVILALLGLAPRVYNNQLFLTNLVVYLVLAQGVNLIYGYTGYLPFGYVGFFGAGAYGAYLAVHFMHAPGIVAVLAGGVAAITVGSLLAPLLRLSGAYFALASLAASQALYYIISSGSLTSVTNGPYGVNLAAIFNETQAYTVGLVVLGVALAVLLWTGHSRFGLSLRAIRSDPVSASMAGVHVVRTRTIAWLIGAALAGLGGAVIAWTTSVFYPETVFSLNISLFAIVFALFGGVGTLLGPVVGTLVLYSLYQYIGLSDPQYFQLIFGLLIVLLVLFFPRGLTSLADRAGWGSRLIARPRAAASTAQPGAGSEDGHGGLSGLPPVTSHRKRGAQ
jgi:branched-chain amino acid transport system permease protein